MSERKYQICEYCNTRNSKDAWYCCQCGAPSGEIEAEDTPSVLEFYNESYFPNPDFFDESYFPNPKIFYHAIDDTFTINGKRYYHAN